MNIPADPQVARKTKRYYDPQPSMKRTNILRIILLLSSLVIGGVVVFLIVYFVTRKPQLIPRRRVRLSLMNYSATISKLRKLYMHGLIRLSRSSMGYLPTAPSYQMLIMRLTIY